MRQVTWSTRFGWHRGKDYFRKVMTLVILLLTVSQLSLCIITWTRLVCDMTECVMTFAHI